MQLIMVLKQSAIEVSVFGTPFRKKLRIPILFNSLRIKSNTGIPKSATAESAGSTFLNSAFYSFTLPYSYFI